jgi:hypothetical protein
MSPYNTFVIFPQEVYGARELRQGSALRSNERTQNRALDPPPSPLLSCFQLLEKMRRKNGEEPAAKAKQARARKKAR